MLFVYKAKFSDFSFTMLCFSKLSHGDLHYVYWIFVMLFLCFRSLCAGYHLFVVIIYPKVVLIMCTYSTWAITTHSKFNTFSAKRFSACVG